MGWLARWQVEGGIRCALRKLEAQALRRCRATSSLREVLSAGGGIRTSTEVALLRILSRLTIAKNPLFYWQYFHQM